jgi:branched-chain amino acid transport system substrate-binding protein
MRLKLEGCFEGDTMGPERSADTTAPQQSIARRSVLKGVGTGALAVGAGGILSACGSGIKGSGGSSSAGSIKIGFVTPLTGDLAGFGSGDKFVLSTVQASSSYAKGFKVGGKSYKVDVVVADSQSDPSRASEVARQLILSDHVDMILTTSTPETTNPVSGVCQAQGMPCLSTVVPWESWYAGLGGNPLKPTKTFQYTTMFFFGMKEFAGTFLPMWNRVSTDKVFAGMFPNDADGNAFRAGFPPFAEAAGYKFIDGGAFTDGTTDYSSMISKFKSSKCETFTNCPLPPDFNAFWKQAAQQGWKPKIATVAKVLLFPADTVALGSLVTNIATDSWWGPYMPYKSSLTGQTAKELADAYQSSSGSQWLQALGSTYSLFEVAREAFTAVSDPHDKAAVAKALHNVNYSGMCGPIDFAGGPAPGVGIIKPVGVQWKPGTAAYPFEMQVVDNSLNASVPITAKFEPTNA